MGNPPSYYPKLITILHTLVILSVALSPPEYLLSDWGF